MSVFICECTIDLIDLIDLKITAYAVKLEGNRLRIGGLDYLYGFLSRRFN